MTPVNPKLSTVRHTESTFPSLQTPATAVTVTSGTSATKVWNWKILPTSLISSICLFSALLPKKLPRKASM